MVRLVGASLLGALACAAKPPSPKFDGKDPGRPRVAIELRPVAHGFVQPTDVQFVPGQPDEVYALGRYAMAPSTFGRDAAGRIYVADYGSGTVYRLEGPR